MKKTFSRFALVLPLALAGGLPASVAFAQQRSAVDVAQARELFNQGLTLRDNGDINGAIEKLRAAHALATTPITGVELARTYMQAGKLVEAREAFLSVGRIPVQREETSRAAAARKESADLAEQVKPRIPSILVRVTGVPLESATVTIDGDAVPTEALAAARGVNPGSHKIAATATNGAGAEATVDLKEGDSKEVILQIAATGSPPAVAGGGPAPVLVTSPAAGTNGSASSPPSSSTSTALMITGFSLAGVGIIAGSVTGAMALSKASAVKSACQGTVCPTSVDGDLTSGRALGTVSTVAFAAAGVGAVLGVIGLLIAPHQESAPAPGPTARVVPWMGLGSAGVTGTF